VSLCVLFAVRWWLIRVLSRRDTHAFGFGFLPGEKRAVVVMGGHLSASCLSRCWDTCIIVAFLLGAIDGGCTDATNDLQYRCPIFT